MWVQLPAGICPGLMASAIFCGVTITRPAFLFLLVSFHVPPQDNQLHPFWCQLLGRRYRLAELHWSNVFRYVLPPVVMSRLGYRQRTTNVVTLLMFPGSLLHLLKIQIGFKFQLVPVQAVKPGRDDVVAAALPLAYCHQLAVCGFVWPYLVIPCQALPSIAQRFGL